LIKVPKKSPTTLKVVGKFPIQKDAINPAIKAEVFLKGLDLMGRRRY